MIRFIPTQTIDYDPEYLYKCPLYKTASRAGTLSTTGQSTNYVLALHLPTDKGSNYWILKGVALLVYYCILLTYILVPIV